MHRASSLALALALFAAVLLSACAHQRTAVRAPKPKPSPPASEQAHRAPIAPNEEALSKDEEASLLHRISQLYGYQSKILEAQADGDVDRAEALFEEALQDLTALLDRPGVAEHPRFRAVYRSLLMEYEKFHGAPPDDLALPQGRIFAFRDEAFSALNRVRDPLLEDVTFPEVQPVFAEVPLTRNRLVEQSIDFLLQNPETHLYHWISRADTYFPMIEQTLREVGAPVELKYLAMIESGLNPQAVSWAGAVGMWQFMSATGRAYGLQINGWVDERRDPEEATRAAARHLLDLYERFDDWLLAIAGYNCGAGNVEYALRRASSTGREATFWGAYPYLPGETRNYVPMYIAAALVASNPTAFGVNPAEVPDGPRYAYDYVPLTGSAPLSTIAELAGTTTATIRALNPELRRSYTPPTEEGEAYYVRIPRGTYQRFITGYAQLPDDVKQPITEHVVRQGDTLTEIADRYGISVSALMQRNGLPNSLIHPGQHLFVPVPNYDGDLSLADAEPMRVVYGQRVIQPLAALPPDGRKTVDEIRRTLSRQGATAMHAGAGDLTVDEALQKLRDEQADEGAPEQETDQDSQRPRLGQGPSVEEVLQKLNGTEEQEEQNVSQAQPTDLQPDRTATTREAAVPVRNASLRAPSTEEQPPAPASEQPETPQPEQPEGERTVYEVRSGDTLGDIARLHSVSVDDLKQWNDLASNRINEGQELVMYGAEEPEHTTYRVRSGDTLGEIAARHGVSASDLRRWNGLAGSRIYPGQELKLYGAEAPATSRLTHRVRPGDTLIEIAALYDVDTANLKEWNDLSSNRIRVGQDLTIYADGPVLYRVRSGDNLIEIAREYDVSVDDLRQWNDLSSDHIYPGQELKIFT